MSTEPQTPTALLAARSVASLLPQVATAAAGASVLGLLAGWREATAYFSGLGAPWFVASLTPSMLLERTAGLMTLLAVSAFFSIHNLSRGETSAKGLRRYSLAFLSVSLALLLPSILSVDWISKKSIYLCATFGAFAIAVSAGATIGEVVARLADSDLKWSSYHAWLVYSVVFFALVQAPDRLGAAKAQYHLDPASNGLPSIDLSSPTPSKSWRLVALLGNQFLIVSLGEKPSGRVFRIVDANAIAEIRSTETNP